MAKENLPCRKRLRLRDHDYTQGTYFVTLCVAGSWCLFGRIEDGRMRLSPIGRVVEKALLWIPEQYPYVQLNAYAIMPNHVHAIICLFPEEEGDGNVRTGGSRTAPTRVKTKTLGSVIGAYKTVSTKHVNEMRHTPGLVVWQRDFYDRILVTSRAVSGARRYTENNAAHWQWDRENPNRI